MSAAVRPDWLRTAAERAARCPQQHQLGDRVVSTGRTLIGSGHQRPLPADCEAISGPHRAAETLGDKAVRWACVVALVFLVLYIGAERLA